MASYRRLTAAPVREVLRIAEEVLPARLPLEKVANGGSEAASSGHGHSVTFAGKDGTVTITAHRHGFETVVEATTDQLRTSRIDLETQYFLNRLPYQPGDVPTR
jgi:hypothetical protein